MLVAIILYNNLVLNQVLFFVPVHKPYAMESVHRKYIPTYFASYIAQNKIFEEFMKSDSDHLLREEQPDQLVAWTANEKSSKGSFSKYIGELLSKNKSFLSVFQQLANTFVPPHKISPPTKQSRPKNTAWYPPTTPFGTSVYTASDMSHLYTIENKPSTSTTTTYCHL
jgi:hypothetical protein